MTPEIIKFYADKGLEIEKLIQNRPENTTPEQIRLAALKVYRDIQKGLRIKDIQIGHRVLLLSKRIDVEKVQGEIQNWNEVITGERMIHRLSKKDIEIIIKLKGIR